MTLRKVPVCRTDETEKLLKGRYVPTDFNQEFAQPIWYNSELFDRGKKFQQSNLFCIFLSDLMSILLVLSNKRILNVLMRSSKSETNIKALKRYVSTIRIVIAWIEGDIWNENDGAHQALIYVTKSHNLAGKMSLKKKQGMDNVKIPTKTNELSIYTAVNKDLIEFQPTLRDDLMDGIKDMNQWDMAVVQYAFLGPILASPRDFGLQASDDDLEGFLHFWRVIGYLMGIRDEFNLGAGDLQESKALMKELAREIFLPNFSTVGEDFELMAQALCGGMNMAVPFISYPCSMCYLINILGGKTNELGSIFRFQDKILYGFLRGLIFSIRFKPVRIVFGWLFKLSLDLIEGKGPYWWPAFWSPKVNIPSSKFSENM